MYARGYVRNENVMLSALRKTSGASAVHPLWDRQTPNALSVSCFLSEDAGLRGYGAGVRGLKLSAWG